MQSSRRGYRTHLKKLLQSAEKLLATLQPLTKINVASLRDLHKQLQHKQDMISPLNTKVLEALGNLRRAWDEPLSEEYQAEWRDITTNFKEATGLSVRRCYFPSPTVVHYASIWSHSVTYTTEPDVIYYSKITCGTPETTHLVTSGTHGCTGCYPTDTFCAECYSTSKSTCLYLVRHPDSTSVD